MEPNLNEIDARLAKLSPAERRRFIERIQQKLRPAGETSVPRAQRDEPLLLSFAQQRLWFLDQLAPNSPHYNVTGALRLRGPLDRQAMEKTFAEIVRRHEALRTCFENAQGQPRQVIVPEWPGPIIQMEDLRPTAAEDREAEVVRRAQEEAARPFDLSQGPLIRIRLWQLEQDEHVLFVNQHHIVSDGWSVEVLMREFRALYAAFSQGAASPLPDLEVQYADFALWQRNLLQGEALDRHLAFWREQLAGAPLVELPTDHPRPAVASNRGDAVRFELPPELVARIRRLCRDHESSLFMLLLAAWQLLLGRYSRQDDLVVGVPVANRARSEFESLIGFFLNTLALRADLSGDPRFVDFLANVRDRTLRAYDHQELPFEQLIEALGLARDRSRESLVEVMFGWQIAPTTRFNAGPLTLDPIELPQTTAKFDLNLMMWEIDSDIRGSLEYRTDLFERETIRRMAGHLVTLLADITRDPRRRLSQLSLLPESERHALLDTRKDNAAEYPDDKCLHELFEQQVRRTPDAVAVEFEDQHLTYRQLNARANQLARHLVDLGVGADAGAAICVERSLEMVVAVLGTLKAGGAYVPLDPSYPADRLAFMLGDSQACALMTQESLATRFPGYAGPIVRLDSDAAQIDRQSTEDLGGRAQPDNLAYVIYTSGSTGKPKGVLMPHRPLVNLIHWDRHHSAVASPGKRTIQFASLSFDASFTELFTTFYNGGTLVLVPAMLRNDPFRFPELLKQRGIHRIILPCCALHQLADSEINHFPDLREVVSTGEQLLLTPALRAFLQRHPGALLVNDYGPSETHVVTRLVIPVEDLERFGALPPIGRPVANTELLVLDDHRQPVPAGVAGELYIGGTCLARGYLDRVKLTEERFVRHPFSRDPQARLYRTGDLCRWRHDGNLEFLGRLDHQVKIRGFRVEMGEIESALSSDDRVREAVVVAREDAPGQKRLVGYVVAAAASNGATADVDVRQLREKLALALPEYMVPRVIMVLDSLPLTPSGKVDRKALPVPDAGDERQREYAPPRTRDEEELCSIWQRVLDVPRVGVTDNFFELGGHSLLATQTIARVADALGVQLPVKLLFEEGTVAAMGVALVEARQTARSEAAARVKAQIDRMDPDQIRSLLAQKRADNMSRKTEGDQREK